MMDEDVEVDTQPSERLPVPAETSRTEPAAPVVKGRGPVAAPAPQLMTVDRWARGRNDPIMRAFVTVTLQARTEKKTPSNWMEAYKAFLKQPRG